MIKLSKIKKNPHFWKPIFTFPTIFLGNDYFFGEAGLLFWKARKLDNVVFDFAFYGVFIFIRTFRLLSVIDNLWSSLKFKG